MTPTEAELILKEIHELFDGDAFQDLKTKVDKMDEAIRGNGKVGLITRMELVEKWINDQVWVQRLIYSVLITEGLGMIILLIKELATK